MRSPPETRNLAGQGEARKVEIENRNGSDPIKTPRKRQAKDTSQARWKARNQWAVWAHTCLAAAIRRGLVKRQPCSVCGTTDNVDGHHFSYEKPADVTWLCRLHHVQTHRRALKPKRKGGAK